MASVVRTRSRSYPMYKVAFALLGQRVGRSQREVARDLNVPRRTIRQWWNDYESGDISVSLSPHAHSWVLTSPNNYSTVRGLCMVCFEYREGYFHNSITGTSWNSRRHGPVPQREV